MTRFFQRYFPPPARFSAPLLVLVFGFAVTWCNYQWNLADDLARGQVELREEANATGARLARLGEQLQSPVGIAALQADLAASVEAPDLKMAAFANAHGAVLAGSSVEIRGREVGETLLRSAANLMQQGDSANVLYSQDSAQLYAAYPVLSTDSWVLLVYDRSATMKKAREDAWRSLEWSALATGVLGMALWWILHFGFAKRIARLAAVMRSFDSGKRQAIPTLHGGDEVAELSRSFSMMAKSVMAHEEQRTVLEKQILEAGERERLRIGHELHDGLGQRLTAVAVIADILAESLTNERMNEAYRAHDIAKQIREAVRETRQLSHGLAPVGIEKGKLVTALSEMAAVINTGGQARVVVECSPSEINCSPELATQLFRIAQEAVNNALKHALPSEIRLGMSQSDTLIVLEIEDDGKGLPEKLPLNSGIGLSVMQHRAQVMGGKLTLAAATAGGTLVRCEIPYHL